MYTSPFLSRTSLLRYPGGKTRAVNIITEFFPEGIKEICSPFFGGGSIEIYLASKGIKVYGYDNFTPLVEFWQVALKNPKELAKIVRKYYPLTKDDFYKLQQIQTSFKTKIERAAVFYVLNRSSFSGSTLSGGMSPNHPRFTISAIERLEVFQNKNLDVTKADFHESINLHPNTFLYLDPPYLIKSTLYGKKGNTHKDFDHFGLSKILKNRNNWVLSYNDCEEIREVYKPFEIISPIWKYGMSSNKSSKEDLIFSRDIKPKLQWQDKQILDMHGNTH